jgi:hypothetical protein
MGYTTSFDGEFDITPSLAREDYVFLKKFSETRRMGRRGLGAKYGVEGEFYVDGLGDFGQGDDPSIIDYNRPPSTQPGLWCQWTPDDDGTHLKWNEGEKFYEYTKWLEYLINKVLAPRGYTLHGDCAWQGEDSDDRGLIQVRANKVQVFRGRTVYDSPTQPPEEKPVDQPVGELPQGHAKVKRTKAI